MFFRGGRGMRGPRKGYQIIKINGNRENGIQIAMIRVYPCDYIYVDRVGKLKQLVH